MQVDDGAKAAPETILNAGEDWLTIIEGSLHVIPQDHWGIGATIKVRLDGDNLIISADEPGYSESTSVRIPALTTRRGPAMQLGNEERAALVADLTVILQRVKYVKPGESLNPIAEEIIELVTAARDAEIREALLSDGAVQAAYDALLNPHFTDADMSHMPEVLQAVTRHIGLGDSDGTGGQG